MKENTEFARKIGRLSKSTAYLDFCEEVCGYRIALFNMMDRAQLDYIFRSIPILPSDTVLDVGCGDGGILRALSEKTGCAGVGVDLLKNADGEKLCFIQDDIDEITRYSLNPAVTLCIDSLYFSADPEKLVRRLCGLTGKGVYLFYSQYLFEGCETEKYKLQSDATLLGEILRRNAIPYTVLDYSENERALYSRSISVLEKRKAAFFAEGNGDLNEEKFKEQETGLRLYDEGCASRYLYILPPLS